MSDRARDDLVAAMGAVDAYYKASKPWDEDQSREHCYLACSAFISNHGPALLALLDDLAALRARHEKLRDGCKALVEVWRDTANYGTDPDKSAAERLLFDTVHGHADELNALLEDE